MKRRTVLASGVLALALAQPALAQGSVKILAPANGARLDALDENRLVYEVVPAARRSRACLHRRQGSRHTPQAQGQLSPGKHGRRQTRHLHQGGQQGARPHRRGTVRTGDGELALQPENLAYAIAQVVHNYGAAALVGASVFWLWPLPRQEYARVFAAILLAAWCAQIASGIAFGATSLYFYGATPDLGAIALAALVIKIVSAAAGSLFVAWYLLRGGNGGWPGCAVPSAHRPRSRCWR